MPNQALMRERYKALSLLSEERARPEPSEAIIAACEFVIRQTEHLKTHKTWLEYSGVLDD